jgi:hypothetical protein
LDSGRAVSPEGDSPYFPQVAVTITSDFPAAGWREARDSAYFPQVAATISSDFLRLVGEGVGS